MNNQLQNNQVDFKEWCVLLWWYFMEHQKYDRYKTLKENGMHAKFAFQQTQKDMRKNKEIKQAKDNLKYIAPIVEEFKGYIILAQNNAGVENKKRKILAGDVTGFLTIEQALKI